MASTASEGVSQELSIFFPQPGDIILLQNPIVHTDGTFGPLVKIYKDNFHFGGSPDSYRMSIPPVHEFKRGEKILRLYKLYQNWEFVGRKTQNLHLYYPGHENNRPWHLVSANHSKDRLKTFPPITHFSHLPPSKLFTTLSRDVFTPRPRDIIIHTIPDPEVKDPGKENCEDCKLRKEYNELYWEIPPGLDASNLASVPGFENPKQFDAAAAARCDDCAPQMQGWEKKPSGIMPWETRWEMENWSEMVDLHSGDVLVRYDIDAQYDGPFKKSHLQVELFAFTTPEKKWIYLGMDVARFGPVVQVQDVVYRPLPGDIIISRNKRWTVGWDSQRHTGGSVVFQWDPGFFGDQNIGQNLWLFESEKQKLKFKKTPVESWLVRLGTFDEFWDFHLNDRAEIFLMHPNGKTMLRHFSTDYPHMAQPPNYKFENQPPTLMAVVELEPNHWDLVVRYVERVYEDPLRMREWARDPNHWMRDPMLWGKDIPPRFDKEVEMFTYWSGFVFEDKDLLLRAGYAVLDDDRPEPNDYFFGPSDGFAETPYGPRNENIPPLHTDATVELYEVKVDGDNPPEFVFFGRDRFCFPDEYKKEPVFEYLDDSSDSAPPQKTKKDAKVTGSKDGVGGETSKGKKKNEGNKQEKEDGKSKDVAKEEDGKSKAVVKEGEAQVREGQINENKKPANENDVESLKDVQSKELALEATRTLKLSGGDEISLP